MEFAGNASLHSLDPSSPLYPLQLDADVHWNADTGATAHMTPHHHWMRNYTPKCVPVKLADNKVVYSAGVGSVVFVPVIGGRRQHAGATALPLWSMSGIGVLLRLLRTLLPMNCGMGASLMCPTFEFGAVLPMCICRRTRGNLWSPTWKSASF